MTFATILHKKYCTLELEALAKDIIIASLDDIRSHNILTERDWQALVLEHAEDLCDNLGLMAFAELRAHWLRKLKKPQNARVDIAIIDGETRAPVIVIELKKYSATLVKNLKSDFHNLQVSEFDSLKRSDTIDIRSAHPLLVVAGLTSDAKGPREALVHIAPHSGIFHAPRLLQPSGSQTKSKKPCAVALLTPSSIACEWEKQLMVPAVAVYGYDGEDEWAYQGNEAHNQMRIGQRMITGVPNRLASYESRLDETANRGLGKIDIRIRDSKTCIIVELKEHSESASHVLRHSINLPIEGYVDGLLKIERGLIQRGKRYTELGKQTSTNVPRHTNGEVILAGLSQWEEKIRSSRCDVRRCNEIVLEEGATHGVVLFEDKSMVYQSELNEFGLSVRNRMLRQMPIEELLQSEVKFACAIEVLKTAYQNRKKLFLRAVTQGIQLHENVEVHYIATVRISNWSAGQSLKLVC